MNGVLFPGDRSGGQILLSRWMCDLHVVAIAKLVLNFILL